MPHPPRLLAASLLLLGCHTPPTTAVQTEATTSSPDPTTEPDTSTPGQTAKVDTPACTASIAEGGEVLVDGKPTGLRVEAHDYGRVRTFAWERDAILLALGSELPYLEFLSEGLPTDTLWRVPCANPGERSVELQIEDAEFSWAVLGRDGKTMYFTRLGSGVQRLDFAARDYGPIEPPPPIELCWMAEGPTPAEELVVDWVGDDALLVITGGPCGFEAEFAGKLTVIEDPGGAARRRRAAYVGPVVLDAQRRIWIGDGGLCREQATVNHWGTANVWRSDDAGASFIALPVPDAHTGVELIWTATDNPDHVLVRTTCCYESAADTCTGGKLMRSDDAGQTWTAITPAGELRYQGMRVSPDLRTLELEVVDVMRGEPINLHSQDGGLRWRERAHRRLDGFTPTRSVELDGVVFEAGPDGLTRRENTQAPGTATIVFRPPPPREDGP